MFLPNESAAAAFPSSEESAAPHRRHSSAVVASLSEHQKRRRVVKKKRPPRAALAPAPLGRLGWLGEGISSLSMTGGVDHRKRGDVDVARENDHVNSSGYPPNSPGNSSVGGGGGENEKYLTLRRDYDHTHAAAIDLTGDYGDDDVDQFTFRDDNSSLLATANGKKRPKRSFGANSNKSSNDNKIKTKANEVQEYKEEWACRKCTFLNPPQISICVMCNSRRESTRGKHKSCHHPGGKNVHHGVLKRDENTINAIRGKRGCKDWKDDTRQQHQHTGSSSSAKRPNLKKARDSGTQFIWEWASCSSSSSRSLSQQQPLSFMYRSSNNSEQSKMCSTIIVKQRKQQQYQSSERERGPIDAQMWTDKYTPRTSKDLCVAPKKVEEIRRFLSSHVSHARSRRRNTNGAGNVTMGQKSRDPWEMPKDDNDIAPRAKLMILVGSPGVGKSATVRTLADETGMGVLTWNDAHVEYNNHFVRGHAGSYLDPANLPYQSQLSSFEDFLSQGGAGMVSLDFGVPLKEDDGRGIVSQKGKRKRDGNGHVSSLILVEEIPNLYNTEAAQLFRSIMERHIRSTQIPMFFIFSDVQGGAHRPEDLERLIPPHVLYSPLVQIVPIQPVTRAKMKKCLQSIAKVDGLSLPKEFFEEMHLASGGDLRHAILAMQFRYGRSAKTCSGNCVGMKKDVKLSPFHALGKLLYARRRSGESHCHAPPPSVSSRGIEKWDDGRGPLDFVPEEVLDRIEMGMGSVIAFLSYHAPDFFKDTTDLSRSLGSMSDAATFLDRFSQEDGPFPVQYASCIIGRAVADGNRNPTPPQFRQITAPKVFSVIKKRRENETKIEQLRKRMSAGDRWKASLHKSIGLTHQFVTDSLPFMRLVIPKDVDYALANLHSYMKDGNGQASDEQYIREEKANSILMGDDLVDDDHDW